MTREEIIANKANLSGANLSDANLSDANLSDANLSDANLSYANLSYANLSHANLSDATLSDANLSYANLSYANLSDAEGVISAGYPNGYHFVAWTREGVLWINAGCRSFSASDAELHWATRQARVATRAALVYVKAIAQARGWIS